MVDWWCSLGCGGVAWCSVAAGKNVQEVVDHLCLVQ